MAIRMKLLSLDNYFRSLDYKIVLNDINFYDKDVESLIYSICDSEIEFIKTCVCGKSKSNLLKICPYCKSELKYQFDTYDPILWIKTFLPDVKFLNPVFYTMLREILSDRSSSIKSDRDYLRYLMDTDYRILNVPPTIKIIAETIGGRGYLNVINNLELILLYLKNSVINKSSNKYNKISDLLKLLEEQEDALFSDYIPILNRNMFIINYSGKNRFIVLQTTDIINISKLPKIVTEHDLEDKKLLNFMGELLSRQSTLYVNYLVNKFAGKKKIIRKHVFGTRSHFTARYIITSSGDDHDYNTIQVPRELGLVCYRPQLINKMLKLGFTYKEISRRLVNGVVKEDELLDKLLQELIDDSPYKGLPVLLNRNPSLLQGSVQLVYIDEFKKDISDNSISVNLLIIKAFNGDFDGDEMGVTIIHDKKLHDHLYKLSPWRNIISTDGKINSNLYLNPSLMKTITNYLTDKTVDDRDDSELLKRLVNG